MLIQYIRRRFFHLFSTVPIRHSVCAFKVHVFVYDTDVWVSMIYFVNECTMLLGFWKFSYFCFFIEIATIKIWYLKTDN